MYRVLIADDNHEDRELLRLEITRALAGTDSDPKFAEAVSVAQALGILKTQPFDLLTLDIEFDRMNEGLDALPGIFENYPALNIIVISGKLNKAEVTAELFRFTKDNVLKGKRWSRHFDVLDKKDDKALAIRAAHAFTMGRRGEAEKLKELFMQAEHYLDQGEPEKCLNVYRRIQEIAPGERESGENIRLLKGEGYEQALDYYRKGERVVAGLLLGHHIETRLKAYTRRAAGRHQPALMDCLRELERVRRFGPFRKSIFQKLMKVRNKSVHHPESITEREFEDVQTQIKTLEADF